jgi:hypothetical protein
VDHPAVCARDLQITGVLQLDDEVLVSVEGALSAGVLNLRIGDEEVRLRTIDVLEGWRAAGTRVASFVSIEHELVGLVHEATAHAVGALLAADCELV